MTREVSAQKVNGFIDMHSKLLTLNCTGYHPTGLHLSRRCRTGFVLVFPFGTQLQYTNCQAHIFQTVLVRSRVGSLYKSVDTGASWEKVALDGRVRQIIQSPGTLTL